MSPQPVQHPRMIPFFARHIDIKFLQKPSMPSCKIQSAVIDSGAMTNKDVLLLVSPTATPCLRGITRFAHDSGWFVTIEDRDHPPRDWRGDGVLATIGQSRVSLLDFVRHTRKRGIPVVDLTDAVPSLRIPRVCGDNLEIGRIAAEHFLMHGFHRAAWFSSKWGNVQQQRLQGFTANGFPESEKLVGLDRPHLAQKLASMPKPLAVFAYSDNDASRVLNACRDAHIAVPEEVAILGVDNNELICLNQPTPLSSIRHNLERVGYEGAALLQRLMDSGTTQHRQKILIKPCGVAVRQSTEIESVDDPLLRKAFAIMRRDIAKPTGIEQISAEVGASHTELNRIAKRELGRTLLDELIRQRLARAKVLLTETDMTLHAIASETGFCHAAHLANAFRKTFGITPGRFRKRVDD